jgi:hypothetical protein
MPTDHEQPGLSVPCNRRDALGRLAGLLAAGLWPGALRAEAAPAAARAGEIVFAAPNDFHHDEPACDPWFEALFRQIGSHPGLQLCLGVGDLAHRGKRASFEAIARLSRLANVPFLPVAGNHDCDVTGDTSLYAEIFPGRLNYTTVQQGWQFVAIDTTAGTAWEKTVTTAATLTWLDGALATLDPRRPTILFTHFPLLPPAKHCILNAEEVLTRFGPFNLRLVLTGHYHAKTTVRRGPYELVTNVCCSRVAGNHDGSTEKGYWLCRGSAAGQVTREFVPFAG